MKAGALVLAAGEGRRFGGPKQLAELHGEPVLAHVLRAVAAVPALAPVVLVLGARAEEIREALGLALRPDRPDLAATGVRVVVAPDWAEGQSASLRAGVAALGDVDAALVLLGDQPLITAEVIAGTLAAADHEDDAVRAAYAGVPGHPVLLGRRVLDGVPGLHGDVGARELLAGFRVKTWEAGHLGDARDVDTREQLEAMR